MYLYFLGLVLLITVAAMSGLWLGRHSAATDDLAAEVTETTAPPATKPSAEPPLYLSLQVPAGPAREAVRDEIALSANAGLHQYVLSVVLPWQGDMAEFLEPVSYVLSQDPAAQFLLKVSLDPPAEWLRAHPQDAAKLDDTGLLSVSLASEAWHEDAKAALEAMVSAVNSSAPGRVQGYILSCLDNGSWYHSDGYDRSEANTKAFQEWLKARYADDAALQTAWGDPVIAREMAAIPQRSNSSSLEAVFLTLPQQRPISDYLQYTSDCTANAIEMLAGCIKDTAGQSTVVLAYYGYSFELLSNDAGHFALGKLLDGKLDGFASPVSYFDRGLGGTGGVMGPVDSVAAHGKKWYLIDDTRTGIAFDPATGEIERPKNVRPEDVYSVQQRNFALAVTHQMGLFWSDPQGDGQLCDAGMWERFAKMADIYQEIDAHRNADDVPLSGQPELAVVVDEVSRSYQQCDKLLNDILLNQNLESVIRAGIRTKFYLLSDVLDERVAPANVYLFLNAFHLNAEDRDRLHGVLERNRATAIWLYAPGYITDTASVDNISATVCMTVKAFDKAERMGSTSLLSESGSAKPFGKPVTVYPAFYIDDPKADSLAEYTASRKTSIASHFFAEWSSIYCAEPSLTGPLLRELLRMLEMPLPYREATAGDGMTEFYDAVYFGPNLLAIHAKESGERIIDLGEICHIRDLFSPEIGWQRKRTFGLHLRTGDTRLLRLTPIGAEEEY